jgi:carbamoyl-phosphate synthase large subunit
MQPKSKIKILVTGVGGPAGINIARLLRQRDDVVVTGCDVDVTASGQVFVDEFVIAPYVRDAQAYESWMRDMVTTRAYDIVIPTVHEELPLLATFAAELPTLVPLSGPATLQLGADKFVAYEWMKINLPKYAPRVTSLRDWTPAWSTDDTLFIKPRAGRGARGCKAVTHDELLSLQALETLPEDIVVMELLPGTEWTVDAYVAKDGHIVYLIPRERMGLAGGISIKGKTVRHEGVIEATKALITQLDMRGPVCIQWKADAEGQPKFVEINPRLSGGLMISVAAGINPVTALIEEYEGQTPTEQLWEEVLSVGYLDYKVLKKN